MLNDAIDPTQVTEKIIALLRQHHRAPASNLKCQHLGDKHCFSHQYNKINELVLTSQLITFILPAFPAKSPNPEKTAGTLPDLGERLSLCLLNNICNEINKFYSPGAQMIICSDGRVFSDLVQITDNDVNAYAIAIKQIIAEENLTWLSTFSLDDCYSSASYDTMRKVVTSEFGETLATLKNKVKTHSETKLLFNGIHRFIFEDQLVHIPSSSKNKIRRIAKEIAYQVIQRSNAWSTLLKSKFPDTIRLSIHPQPCGSDKLGIMLLESKDAWATPWHRVVLKNGTRCFLIRNKDAEFLYARPVFSKNQFSHYII